RIDPGETCDDDNDSDGDGCDHNCKPTGCGNGVETSGEACDDGNTTAGDGCSASCVVECGNATLEGQEQCDGANLNGTNCVARGFVGGTLACGSDCRFDTSACLSAPVCDNGTLEIGESCEDGNSDDGDGCSAICKLEPDEIEPNEDGTPSLGFG